jgi:hypothetical protein
MLGEVVKYLGEVHQSSSQPPMECSKGLELNPLKSTTWCMHVLYICQLLVYLWIRTNTTHLILPFITLLSYRDEWLHHYHTEMNGFKFYKNLTLIPRRCMTFQGGTKNLRGGAKRSQWGTHLPTPPLDMLNMNVYKYILTPQKIQESCTDICLIMVKIEINWIHAFDKYVTLALYLVFNIVTYL